MKRMAIFVAILGLCVVPAARAQYRAGGDHAEAGIYADYFHLGATDTDFAGLGGRLGFNVAAHAQLEADMAYDFNQVFSEGFRNPSTGGVSVAKSDLRVLHGLFGPKFQTGGPVRIFVTVKGGFNAFRFDSRPATFSTFGSTVENLRTSNVNGVVYPGTGVEAYLGPIGLRLDVGDEIYFANGAHNNLRVSFGPTIRF